MYHILLISEDRILLKKIYPFLEDNNRFCIHAVPFSMDAADTFRHYRADIVILDTEIFISYESILEQMHQNSWNYSVILLCNNNEPKTPAENIYTISKDHLVKESFDSILNHITSSTETEQKDSTISLNWNGLHNIRIKQGTYHLVYLQSFSSEALTSESLIKIEEKISSYAKLQPVFVTESSLCFLLNRSELKSDFNFAILSQDIHSLLGNECAVLYESSINWQRLLQECAEIKKLQDYTYFFNGQIFCFSEITSSSSFTSEKLMHEQCMQLLQALLSSDRESAVHIVRELYLHTIKTQINFKTVEYIRMQINFFSYLFTGSTMNFNYKCVEEEMNAIIKSVLFTDSITFRSKLSSIICSTIIQIYNNFQSNISLEGIARELNRNKIYLNRIYKEQFNLTILDTLQYLRLEHAKYYLINTKDKVSEIAEHTGFNDIGYFSKFFHHETGTTALEYRALKEGKTE